MHILFICDEYPPGKNGGIGTMVQVLGRELVRQGHQVTVVGLYPYYYGQKDYEVDQGVEVYRLRYGINLGRTDKHFFYKAIGKLPDYIKRNLNGKTAFNKFIEKIHTLINVKIIDVIEIPDWNTFAFNIGFKVTWPQFKVPLIVKSNGSYTYFSFETNVKGDEKFLKIDQELYKRADALSSVSFYTESINKKLFKYNKNVKILYNCIETNFDFDIERKRQESTIIFTGTLIAKKGIFSLLKAWNIVNEKHPNAELKIYGKGNIDSLTSTLNIKSHETVSFLGHTSRNDLYKALNEATAAIFPSYSECFALAPLEAMAVGCPVINTSRASGKELIIDKENGSLIDPDNIEVIAKKIIELIENKELQQRYSINGRRTIVDNFNISKSARDHIDFYNQVKQKYKQLKKYAMS